MDQINKQIFESSNVIFNLYKVSGQIKQVINSVVECYRQGGKVILFGNGGSAADAQHIAAELVGRFKIDREPLPAISLTTDTSILTALGNDIGYDLIFSRQVLAHTKENDVIIAISTSGNSENVISGIQTAKVCGAKTIGLTGSSGGGMKDLDILIQVPSDNTPMIQQAHITIGHIICDQVEKILYE